MQGVANPCRRAVSFSVWDRVLLSTSHLLVRIGQRKLAAKWSGMYHITARVTDKVWKLAIPDAWKVHDMFYTSSLKEVAGTLPVEDPVQLEES